MRTSTATVRISILSTLIVLLASVATADYDTVIAFGDSLTDHGGLNALVPSAPEVWSNGDTWVEYFADELNAALDNNAIGGAMTEGHEDAGIQAQNPNLGLTGQVDTYIAGGPAYVPSRTLFTILIGGNDLLEFLRGESWTDNPIALLTDAMSNIQTAVTDLYDDGATHFLILNLPDLAATPRFNALPPDDITSVRALTLNFNTALVTLVGNLRNNLSGATIHYFDTYAFVNDMIAGSYFANSEDSWLTLDGTYMPTGATNGPEADYLFWDAIHPMTRAHEYLGSRAARSVMAAEEGDDDSTCFITGVLHRSVATPSSGIVLVLMGLTALLFGKNRP
ncbi:hypothetical protein JCM14469_30840 [Desulfatiferula olefinivorans]